MSEPPPVIPAAPPLLAPGALKQPRAIVQERRQFNPQTSQPHPTCISQPGSQLWTNIEEVRRSADGSSGVVFVKTPEGVIVVKANSTIAQELFAAHFVESLLSDIIHAPRLRVCSFGDDKEWGILKQRVIAKAGNDHDAIAITATLDRPVIGVMELAIGKPVDAVAPDEATTWFDQALARQLGALVVYDVLINNSDRLPFGNLWGNEGNPGNILFWAGKGGARIIAIDNRIISISPRLLDEHLSRLGVVIEDLSAKGVEAKCITRLISSLSSFIPFFKPPPSFSTGLYQGMVEVIRQACNWKPEDLVSIQKTVEEQVQQDWQNVWQDMVKLISIEQVLAVIAVFRNHFIEQPMS